MSNYYFTFLVVSTLWFRFAQSITVSCFNESDGATFPNADNNTWYFECRNGSLLLKICPIMHVFHNETKQCILAKDFTDQLSNSTIEADVLFSSTESATTFAVPIFTNTPPVEDPSVDHLEDNPCPCQDTLSPTYFASQYSCEKYFLCYRSRPLELSCCRGHHWNQQHKKCVPENMSSCGIRHNPTSLNLPSCPARGCAMYPHLTVCEYFYYCEDGVRSLQQCDAFFQWDFYAQRCVIRSEAKCITSIPSNLQAQLYQ